MCFAIENQILKSFGKKLLLVRENGFVLEVPICADK
jgi:hypothetical protein